MESWEIPAFRGALRRRRGGGPAAGEVAWRTRRWGARRFPTIWGGPRGNPPFF